MRRLEKSIKRIYSALFCMLMCGFLSIANAGIRNVVRVSLADLQGDGQTVYQRLREIHASALSLGPDTWVVYPYRVKVNIAIPSGAKSIPLTSHTDFGGCTFSVKNMQEDELFLFSLERRTDLLDNETVDLNALARASRRVDVSGSMIDSGDFSMVPSLAQGCKLLYVYDPKVWSKRGNSLDIYRRDVVYIVDGKAQNLPVQPYVNCSGLMCFYDDVQEQNTSCFENLTFCRSDESSRRVYLLRTCGQVGLHVRNISIVTPKEDTVSPLKPKYENDRCLYIRHSVNTLIEDVNIDGTYSTIYKHGYGMRLINLANTTLRNVHGDASWGVTCGFYLNTVTLDDCVLNRFDCHCYCADFTYRHCTFQTDTSKYSSRNCMCQVACAYGYIHFMHCRFVDARPLVIECSYSGAFSGFELSYQDCYFDVDTYPYLVEGLRFDNVEKSRCLPNLYMRDCSLHVSDETKGLSYFLFHFNNQKDEDVYKDTVDYHTTVNLENVNIFRKGKPMSVRMCNKKLTYKLCATRRVLHSTFDTVN